MNRKEITLGADPEFFVEHSGHFVLAEKTGITGTKQRPTPLRHGGAVQVDGCALEFNIQPARTALEFDNNIETTISDIRQVVDRSFGFRFIPSVTFGKDEWDTGSTESKMLGCDPDYDAYTMKTKTPPQGSGDKPFRTAAGHIHIGFTDADPQDPSHIFDCAILSQYLDMSLGQHSVCWDNDLERQRLYGEKGSFRPKPYGMEYRVLSNAWVLNSPLRKFIFKYVKALSETLLDTGGKGVFTYPAKKGDLIESSMCDLYTLWAFVRRTCIPQEVKQAFVDAYNARAFLECHYQNFMNQFLRTELSEAGFNPVRAVGDA